MILGIVFGPHRLHSRYSYPFVYIEMTYPHIQRVLFQRQIVCVKSESMFTLILSISIVISVFFIIPGQSLALQACVSVLFSIQSFPQFSARINMLLLRVCIPSPQLVEQLLHSPNVLHLQSTGTGITTNQNGFIVIVNQRLNNNSRLEICA